MWYGFTAPFFVILSLATVQIKMKKRHQQKLILISIVLFFLWNVPFVTIFDGEAEIFGFPMFYVFIFLSWLVSIVLAYIILKRFYE